MIGQMERFYRSMILKDIFATVFWLRLLLRLRLHFYPQPGCAQPVKKQTPVAPENTSNFLMFLRLRNHATATAPTPRER